VLVEPRAIAGQEGEWLGFETLTLAPIDKALVDRALLSDAETAWWNAYHARVREVLRAAARGRGAGVARGGLRAPCSEPFVP
jgi:Xaa-Pro aminopeptidase